MTKPNAPPNAQSAPADTLARAQPFAWSDVPELNLQLRHAPTTMLLDFAVKHYAGDLVFACSFGLEDMVLLDQISKLQDGVIEVLTLDTGRLPDETYRLWETVQKRYQLKLNVAFPDANDIEAFIANRGVNSIFSSVDARKQCCFLRKVKPLQRHLRQKNAWLTGMRQAQSKARANIGAFEWDIQNGGLLKVNPLWSWSEQAVLDYAAQHHVPLHPWHQQGVPSIGCAPCTRAVPGWTLHRSEPTIDIRKGRWWWEAESADQECGLHHHQVAHEAAGSSPPQRTQPPSSPPSNINSQRTEP